MLKIHKWMRRAAELGLVVFIATPFQGTGALFGVVLGRILGLSRLAIFLSTLIGSTLGAMIVAFAGHIGEDEIVTLAGNPILGIIALAISLAMTYLLGRWFLGQGKMDVNNKPPVSRNV